MIDDNFDEDDEFDELGLIDYINQIDETDGLDVEEALSQGLIDVDDLVPESELLAAEIAAEQEYLRKAIEQNELNGVCEEF
jgi:hypothetical protein